MIEEYLSMERKIFYIWPLCSGLYRHTGAYAHMRSLIQENICSLVNKVNAPLNKQWIYDLVHVSRFVFVFLSK